MKIILVMLTTLDGKITKGSDPDIYLWTSKEEQDYFFTLIKKNSLIVFGSKTYEAVKKRLQLSHERLRIVLTREPAKYNNDVIPGQLEFSAESPQQLVERLSKKGYKTMLLLGGGAIDSLFFKERLVDELYLTLEPRIFGKGKSMTGENDFDISLRLFSVEKLNTKGTLLLKYKFLK